MSAITIRVEKSILITEESPVYLEIKNIISLYLAANISLHIGRGEKLTFSSNSGGQLIGEFSQKIICIPAHVPFEEMLKQTEFTIDILNPKDNPESRVPLKYQADISMFEIEKSIIPPQFLFFYARFIEEAEKKWGLDYSLWPNSWRMGWVIRNAIAHNENISFKEKYKDMTPIIWRNISICFSNQGENIFEKLSFSDILLLLLDMNEDLQNKKLLN